MIVGALVCVLSPRSQSLTSSSLDLEYIIHYTTVVISEEGATVAVLNPVR